MTCMGLVNNYSGLLAVRWFLGLSEAGLFPGVGYFLSCWYKRSEFGVRMAIFFSAAALAGSFGGLLAAAISEMDGVGGKKGWAWIFILEGLVTIVIGFASFWFVYDFPDQATFLSPADRTRVLRRLAADQQSSAEHEEFKMSYFWASVKDWKTWTGAIVYMGADGSLYAFSLFVPTIINELVSDARIMMYRVEN
jgi:MFS family permease